MRVIIIDDERRGDFAGVLPVEAVFGRQTILLGAVDENGFVQGALAVSEDPEQYTIDWLFVDPAVRRHGIGTMLIRQLDHMVNNVGSSMSDVHLKITRRTVFFLFSIRLTGRTFPSRSHISVTDTLSEQRSFMHRSG